MMGMVGPHLGLHGAACLGVCLGLRQAQGLGLRQARGLDLHQRTQCLNHCQRAQCLGLWLGVQGVRSIEC